MGGGAHPVLRMPLVPLRHLAPHAQAVPPRVLTAVFARPARTAERFAGAVFESGNLSRLPPLHVLGRGGQLAQALWTFLRERWAPGGG